MARSKKKSAPIPLYNAKKYRSMAQRHMTSSDRPEIDGSSERGVDPNHSIDQSVTNESDEIGGNQTSPLLSDELMSEFGSQDMILTTKSKKDAGSEQKRKLDRVESTPQEVRLAQQQTKQQKRKLQQIQQRHQQKQLRQQLYSSLQQYAISKPTATEPSNGAQLLLYKSSQLGKKTYTKKEQLQRALQKERLGVALTEHESGLLYSTIPTPPPIESTPKILDSMEPKSSLHDDGVNFLHQEFDTALHPASSLTDCDTTTRSELENASSPILRRSSIGEETSTVAHSSNKNPSNTSTLAAQMMASILSLQQKKTQSTSLKESTSEVSQNAKMDDTQGSTSSNMRTTGAPTNAAVKKSPYIPPPPLVLQTTPSYASTTLAPSAPLVLRNSVCEISNRPADVVQLRQELPVVMMEFEIMDTIRNHDVVIVCSETGSGKSTQIPQFLYESGYGHSVDGSSSTKLMIGITQPRRVAAVSSAKRVCYEMGCGNGQSISKNNVVSYQTRYETAGFGTNTAIQFMTDGILLQEIQSDLLLRKYSVIILDEAHERNLNTDILIGLLSVALPLRKQASQESPSLPPLKVIIMSATLRTEDFTKNPRLFASHPPAVIQVPGRTYPVAVHHSKVTELDHYEDIVFQKTCRIHRQLPPGGILVFLTGKQEIVRMVNRLRRALKDDMAIAIVPDDVNISRQDAVDDEFALRDMDDDEMDGDLWQVSRDEQEKTDDDDVDLPDEDDTALSDVNEATPRVKLKTIILPLYSLLSTEEQARVFAPVPEGYRLIVVATNIAETSITIPGITYVVDSGRQKCRNYNASTGVASFDVMWISQAAADQRAGRAGRTGPGHCYRLYSSSLYAHHLDPFALPEVLTRPLEDVILSMKAMKVANVNDFPFPTPPDRSQIDAAIQLLANIGCVDVSAVEQDGKGDGVITRLGTAVAKLPLGVRYSKILLVAAEAGVLDYAIPLVAALSEASPFAVNGQLKIDKDGSSDKVDQEADDSDDEALARDKPMVKPNHRWSHKGGDVLASMLAVGAYTYAGRGAGGLSEKLACRKFCNENGLHPVIMERIQQMRRHLCHLSKSRLSNADGVAAKTGGYVCSMPPPNKVHEQLLCQSIASGFLDNVAMLAPLGSIPGQHPFSLRSAYLSCSSKIVEPLFMDVNSVVYSRDARRLPKWICYETLIRKTLKDGVTSIAIMKKITPIDPSWLGHIADKSRLLKIGEPIVAPLPFYDSVNDVVLCSVRTKFGYQGWEIPPIQQDMFKSLERHSSNNNNSLVYMPDDSFRWFARFLLEGKVFPELQKVVDMLNDPPSILTRRSASGSGTSHSTKVTLLVSALTNAGIDSAAALRKHWAEVDAKFLFPLLKRWVQPESATTFQKIWISCVQEQVRQWQDRRNAHGSDKSHSL